MKKTYAAILAAALILILLCGTAFAISNYFSVRDLVAEGNPSQQFEENITSVEETKEANGISFSFGDAVFDGNRLVAAMTLTAEDDAKTLFVQPVLEARQGETLIDTYTLFNWNADGFLFPQLTENAPRTHELAISSDIYDETDGDVEWKLSVQLYEFLWPTEEFAPQEDGVTRAIAEEILREAFLDQKILTFGHSLSHLQTAVWTSDPKWLERAPICKAGNSFPEMMVNAGAFALADTVVFDFTTAQPEPVELSKGQVFHFDEYDVEIKSLTQTFMQVDYELELTYHEHPGEVESYSAYAISLEDCFTLIDQDGNELTWLSSGSELEDDLVTRRVYGSTRRISDEPLTSLTFRLAERFMSKEYYEENADRLTFTIEIDP